MSDLIGQSIGRYHIVEQLGRGGMATVYRAFDTRLDREVAIKFIRQEEIGSAYLEQLLKRFEREAKSLAQLSHSNIVKVHDYGEHEGMPFLVMEYLPGGMLKQHLGQPIRPREAARVLAPIARALAYAHQAGIIHRDVKPANILIARSGDPMLTDFGIAKIFQADEATGLTGTGVGIGTPDYMAPEQWTNEVVPQTDIYALGVVFYEMVTGRRPFAADTPAAVLLKQMQDPLPRPQTFVPDLPDQVEHILYTALAKSPKERYASMAVMAEALEALAQHKVPGSPVPAPEAVEPASALPGGRQTSVASPGRGTQGRSPSAESAHPAVSPKTGIGRRLFVPALAGIGILIIGAIGVAAVVAAIAHDFAGKGGVPLKLTAASAAALPSMAPTLLPTKTPQPTAASLLAFTASPFPTYTAWVPSNIPSSTPVRATAMPEVGIGATRVSDIDAMKMVYVPAGTFQMGSADSDGYAKVDEKPQHTVWLDGFWIDRTKVTQGMYAQCVAAGKCAVPTCAHGDSQYPVICVDWSNAQAYCEWAGRRLPTEAEREKAARSTDGRLYPWGNESPDCSRANFRGKSIGQDYCVGNTSPVEGYPSGVGLYGAMDMAGNVWEWVADWYEQATILFRPPIIPQDRLPETAGQCGAAVGSSSLKPSARPIGAKRCQRSGT